MLRVVRDCIWAIFVALLVSGSALAEIYKWTDENGKVHFGDTPPEGDSSSKVKVKTKVASTNTSTTTLYLKGRRAIENNPIKRDTLVDFNKVRLDTVQLSFSSNGADDVVIGHKIEHPSCDPKSGTPLFSPDEGELKESGFYKQFVKTFETNGYPVVNPSTEYFRGMNTQQGDLLMAAVITEMNVDICQRTNTSPVPGMGGREVEVASYMRVKWKLFDPLTRDIIFETESEGSDALRQPGSGNTEILKSDERSFRMAVTNLLSQAEFIKLLAKDNSHTAKDIKSPLPVSVKVTYGRGAGDFVKQVEKLKIATVTVRSTMGHGSGFIISNDGYVVTNAHVIGKSSELLVIAGNSKYRAHVARSDTKRDVALLKIDSDKPQTFLSVSQANARTGEPVYIIGTPLDENLSHTVTQGIISADRMMNGQRYYQTDAAINPGNSGGPAFNSKGDVIGISVAGIFARDGGSMNINFLIPIDEVLASLDISSRVN